MIKLENLEGTIVQYKRTSLKLETQIGNSACLTYLAKDQNNGEFHVVKFGDHIVEEHKIMTLLRKSGGHPNVLTNSRIYKNRLQVNFSKSVKGNIDLNYLVLNYLGSKDLLKFLQSRKIISPELCRDIFSQLADGLTYIHKHKIVHGDIKPNNIVMVENEDKIRPVIIDFDTIPGIESSITGCRYYIPPEVWEEGKYLPQGDLYSLGVIMFKAISGHLPFSEGTREDIKRDHLKKPIPKIEKAPEGLAEIVTKLLQKDPKDRYQSAKELRKDLLKIKF